MNHWQDMVTGVLIVAAVVYLGRLLWCRLVKNTNCTCVSCPGCSQSANIRDPSSRSLPLHDLESDIRK